MSNVLISVLLGFLRNIASTFLGPLLNGIDGLILSLHLDQPINLLNSILYTYIAPFVGFFFEFMGPLTISILLLEFTVYVAYYGLTMLTTWILKVFGLIKKFPLA